MINRENPESRKEIHKAAKKKKHGNLLFNENDVNLSRWDDPTRLFDNDHVNYDFSSASSCAIVGNSGKLMKRELGEEVNSHDCVIRMNTAPVEGYEKHVGSQTDFRFVNGMLMKGASEDFNETPPDWLSTIQNEKLIFGRTTRAAYKHGIFQSMNNNELYFISDVALGLIHGFEKKHEFDHISMGLMASLLFLKACDVVNLYGFGFHQESLDEKHYYEKFSDQGDGDHNWKLEKELVMELHFLGYLNMKDLF